jgi:hypothetical protein
MLTVTKLYFHDPKRQQRPPATSETHIHGTTATTQSYIESFTMILDLKPFRQETALFQCTLHFAFMLEHFRQAVRKL